MMVAFKELFTQKIAGRCKLLSGCEELMPGQL
jgi:hypothetical protein